MRLIDADKLHVDKQINGKCWISQEQIINAPTVEPQEWISLKEAYTKGEWLFEPTQNINNPWKCSCCGHRAGRYKYKTYKFCPWCGAKMDKGEETQRPYKEYQDLRTGEYIREYKGEEDNETETWNGIHAQITAPKGTFDKIWNDTDAEDDI